MGNYVEKVKNRKKKLNKNYREYVDDLKEYGYEVPSKEEYKDMIMMLMVMNKKDMEEFEEAEDKPMWVRYILQDLKNSNERSKIMRDYRDWVYGPGVGMLSVDPEKMGVLLIPAKKDLDIVDE